MTAIKTNVDNVISEKVWLTKLITNNWFTQLLSNCFAICFSKSNRKSIHLVEFETIEHDARIELEWDDIFVIKMKPQIIENDKNEDSNSRCNQVQDDA